MPVVAIPMAHGNRHRSGSIIGGERRRKISSGSSGGIGRQRQWLTLMRATRANDSARGSVAARVWDILY